MSKEPVIPIVFASNTGSLTCYQMESSIVEPPKQNTFIIGITGTKGSGKDTIADFILKTYPACSTKFSFADPLKKACKEIFGFTNEQLYGDKKEEVDEFWHIQPRQILQYVGTDLFREKLGELVPSIGETIWVQSVKRKIEYCIERSTRLIVIPDVRFQNEIDMIHSFGGKIIKVSRIKYPENLSQFILENIEQFKEAKTKEDIDNILEKSQTSHHSSERNINNLVGIDYCIENNSSFEKLYKQVIFIASKIISA
jgi:hypothetical protein